MSLQLRHVQELITKERMHPEIYTALKQAHLEDLQTIYHYVMWVKFRRKVHHAFYQPAHWINAPRPTIHWIH